MSKNILLISIESFKELTGTHTNTDNKLIRPELKVAQDMNIRPILGSVLYDKLLLLVANNKLNETENARYKTIIDDYIVDALINYTLSRLPDATSYQFTNKGVIGKTGEGITQLDYSLLNSIKKKYENTADFYAERLRRYLVTYTALIPEYNAPLGINDDAPDKRKYNSPIYLGTGRFEIKPQPGYNSNDPIIT